MQRTIAPDKLARVAAYGWMSAMVFLPAGYALAGHIHPAVRLCGEGDETLRLACFWFGKRHGVLPACGAFTGSAVVRPRVGDQVFVIAEGEVLRVA